MNIALDYDDTYTKDPDSWDVFILLMKKAGHRVYCVTMRYDTGFEMTDVYAALQKKVDGIYATSRKAKKEFMCEKGIWIDVWIDDNPFFILNAAEILFNGE